MSNQPTASNTRALMVEAVWASTSLGSRGSWPPRLQAISALVRETPMAMCLLWGADLVQLYNEAYADLLGDEHPSMFGRPWRGAGGCPLPIDDQTLASVLAGRALSWYGRECRRTWHGRLEILWCDATFTPIHDEAGAVAGILLIIVDTTGRSATQAGNAPAPQVPPAGADLAQETALLRSFFQEAPSFMAVLRGPDHIFELTNDSFLRLVGREDVIGKAMSEALPELETQPLRAHLDAVAASGEAFVAREMAVALHRRRGRLPEERLIDVVLQPIPDAAGGVRAIFVEGSDVTQRMRAEDALRRLNETLEDAVEARTAELRDAEEALRQSQKMETVGQLTGGIAHDFNNLLGAILSGLELMRLRLDERQLEELPRYIEAATNSANRAAALTHRLLAFSRRQTLDPRPTDVAALVVAMGDLIRRTVGPAIHTETSAEPALWTTLCDPNQLEVALLNLAVNARDAMPEGGHLTISAANVVLEDAAPLRQADTAPGRYVAISVKDTGIGMTQDTQDRAFEPFFTTKPSGQGTGLGLSMVYGFAKQSDGQVRIDSRFGRGTTITIYLPWSAAAPTLVAPPPEIRAQPATGENILIVDDEPVLRGLVAEIVRELGYQAAEAGSGEEALALMHAGPALNLLITDIGMPNMNGRQLADLARSFWPDLKILFITGYVDNSVVNGSLLESGMQMLTKPFTRAALAQKILATMGKG